MTRLKAGILTNWGLVGVMFLAFAISNSFGQETNANSPAKPLIEQGDAAFKKKDYETAIAFYKKAVDEAPTLETLYAQLLYTYRIRIVEKYQNSPENTSLGELSKIEYEKMTNDLEKSFQQWDQKYPNNKVLLYYYSQIYPAGNYAKQEQLLFQSLKLDPNYVPPYSSLSIIEEARGNNIKALEYLRKAADTNPQDPGLAFSYIYSLKERNPKLYRAKSLELAEKFPKSDRGAQSLYWLADTTTDQKERIVVLEKLKNEFPPAQFGWSGNAMQTLFKDYQDTDPVKALEFAKEMVNSSPNEAGKRRWQGKVDFQLILNQAQNLVTEKKYAEALTLLEKVKPQGLLNMTNAYLLKAKALELSGQNAAAYNELLKNYIEEPTDSLQIALKNLGKELGKSQIQIVADINQLLEAKAKSPKDFSFVRIDNGKTVSLSDYRGKVILLSFWYPFCGPCRGEAPFLQKILEKHKDKFVILAPNVHPNEEDFVMPYLKGNKYSFIPLRSNEELPEKEFQAKGYPVNVLLDPQGRVVFRTNSLRGDARRAFELQVEMLAAIGKN